MAILYDWYENPGESDDSEEKGLHPRIFGSRDRYAVEGIFC